MIIDIYWHLRLYSFKSSFSLRLRSIIHAVFFFLFFFSLRLVYTHSPRSDEHYVCLNVTTPKKNINHKQYRVVGHLCSASWSDFQIKRQTLIMRSIEITPSWPIFYYPHSTYTGSRVLYNIEQHIARLKYFARTSQDLLGT